MDDFRRRTSASRAPSRQAMDGFFTRPASPRSPGLESRLRHRPYQSSKPSQSVGVQKPVSRRVDDFRRPDGFHASGRRSLQPATAPRRMRSPATDRALASGLQLDLPDSRQGRRKKGYKKRTRLQTFKRAVFRTTAVAMVLVLGVGGFLFSKGYLKLHKVFQGGSTAAALTTNVDPSLLKGEGDGRVNILLLGVGGPNHDGGDLTDTIMIASIDPVNNQVGLLSIPRDMWTKMPNNYIASYQKINAAYESGKYKYLGRQDIHNTNHKAILAGFDAADSTIERVTGIPIHYNALVNFQAFSKAIDTVGGITINAPEELYDPTMAWENHWNPVLAKKGVNDFNGQQALLYVRSRETSSDFARGDRQRAMLVALKEKTANLSTLTNPLKLSSLISAFGDNVASDISISDMTRIAQIMKKIPSSSIQSISLATPGHSLVTTGSINGMSVVMPKAGLEDYTDIQSYIRSQLTDGYIAREHANITVLNGTDAVGLAGEKSDELKSYGYNIGTVGNAPTDTYMATQIIDLSHGAKKYTLNYLKQRFNVQTVGSQLPAGISPGGADIVIILGTDASDTPQN